MSQEEAKELKESPVEQPNPASQGQNDQGYDLERTNQAPGIMCF